jgi:hypothetical protein
MQFNEDWFSNSEVDKGDTQTHTQHGDGISLLSFIFQIKDSKLTIEGPRSKH